MAASVAGVVGGNGSSSSSWMQFKGSKERKMNKVNKFRICCSSSSSVMDPYKTLRIQPGATESEVRKAFRQLALQYHPDVCRGSNCGVRFHQINEAYDRCSRWNDMVIQANSIFQQQQQKQPYGAMIVMANLRGESNGTEMYEAYDDKGIDEPLRGMNDPDWDMWEEWMGWEGAGIRDYSSHINPYI